MKHITSVLFALAAVAGLLLLTPNTSYASCSDATLSGSYGAAGPGFINPTPSNAVRATQDIPIAIAGLFSFDGTGHVSLAFTRDVNGVSSQGLTSSGGYTVKSDCTGSLSFTTGAAAGVKIDIIIVAGGTEFVGVETDPGVIAALDAKKQ
jgi:hypothetical protein